MKYIITFRYLVYEKLHRYVFDYCYQCDEKYLWVNRSNKFEIFNDKAVKLYDILKPYFKGWRSKIKKAYPKNKRFERYEYV